jgi:hypothetical protein
MERYISDANKSEAAEREEAARDNLRTANARAGRDERIDHHNPPAAPPPPPRMSFRETAGSYDGIDDEMKRS